MVKSKRFSSFTHHQHFITVPPLHHHITLHHNKLSTATTNQTTNILALEKMPSQIPDHATGINAGPLDPQNAGSPQNQPAGSPGQQTNQGGLREGGRAPVFISDAAAKTIIGDGGSVPTQDVIREVPGGGFFIKTGHRETFRQALDIVASMVGTCEVQTEIFPILDEDEAKLRAGETLLGVDIKSRPGYFSSRICLDRQ